MNSLASQTNANVQGYVPFFSEGLTGSVSGKIAASDKKNELTKKQESLIVSVLQLMITKKYETNEQLLSALHENKIPLAPLTEAYFDKLVEKVSIIYKKLYEEKKEVRDKEKRVNTKQLNNALQTVIEELGRNVTRYGNEYPEEGALFVSRKKDKDMEYVVLEFENSFNDPDGTKKLAVEKLLQTIDNQERADIRGERMNSLDTEGYTQAGGAGVGFQKVYESVKKLYAKAGIDQKKVYEHYQGTNNGTKSHIKIVLEIPLLVAVDDYKELEEAA